MKLKEVDITKVTPMMKQYIDIKNENSDVIIFFRLGDFYEMFFEDAHICSKALELTLTGKNAGLDEKIPMCGIPHHSSESYIKKLVSLGYKVGICEQTEEASNTKKIVERQIVKIVSKGTLNSNELTSNNYIGLLIESYLKYTLVYIDVSTGDVYSKKIGKDINSLINTINTSSLSEILSNNEEVNNILKNNTNILVSNYDLIKCSSYNSAIDAVVDEDIKNAYMYLMTYLEKTQMQSFDHFKKLKEIKNNSYLRMDIHTLENLELVETKRNKEKLHSLLWLIDKTKTAPGTRMLKNFLNYPSVDKFELERRYDIIEVMSELFLIRDDLINALDNVYDIERILGKVVSKTANARDLMQLKTSIFFFKEINRCIDEIKFNESLNELDELYKMLDDSIYDNPPVSIKEGYLIKEGFNKELDDLREIRGSGKSFIAQFELEEREKTGIKTLKVGYNRVFGYYIEISKGQTKEVKDEYNYERKQTLTNCERYISPILKEKEDMILNAEEKIVSLEYELFINVRDNILNYINDLQKNIDIISYLDVMQSLSIISEKNNFVRPTINDKQIVDIIESRHPIIEVTSDDAFVPNDFKLDESTNILLITGPNMAGKSTYMRQLAITFVLAQIGCFVPAKSASVYIADAIYTRIGSSDDLISGDSTFMVEMKEANYAVRNATKRSLILLDELGRGTATYDGMALASAIIEYIHNYIGCATLFSTHYHEITDLENKLEKLKNVHVSAIEEKGSITFVHKVKDGSVDKSYGIHVAELAKLPSELIEKAAILLKNYETKGNYNGEAIVKEIVVEKKSKVEEIIKDLNVNEIKPIEALLLLEELKDKLSK